MRAGLGERPPRLYGIADLDILGAALLPAAVETMATCGVRWIQLRAKGASGRALTELAGECLNRVARIAKPATGGAFPARLWIDDRVDVAALLPVAGVHLGQRDLPPTPARRVIGETMMIGRSTHDPAQLAEAEADPAVDVVAIGPVFATTGKRDPDPVVGLDFVRRARRATTKPLVAIGGIDAENAASVLAAGADTVAVLGAVCRGDVAGGCRRLLQATGEAG